MIRESMKKLKNVLEPPRPYDEVNGHKIVINFGGGKDHRFKECGESHNKKIVLVKSAMVNIIRKQNASLVRLSRSIKLNMVL